MSECKHIFNAHAQCQWCHRMKKDIEYEDMKAENERLRAENERLRADKYTVWATYPDC